MHHTGNSLSCVKEEGGRRAEAFSKARFYYNAIVDEISFELDTRCLHKDMVDCVQKLASRELLEKYRPGRPIDDPVVKSYVKYEDLATVNLDLL